jgi:hypothetical protein
MNKKQKKYTNIIGLIYFILSVAFLFFILGILSSYKNTFVYKWFYGSYLQLLNFSESNNTKFEEDFILTGKFDNLILLTQENKDKVYLLNEDGIVHKWQLSNINNNFELNKNLKSKPYGAHLFENGDLIISSDLSDSFNTTSEAFIAKLDKDSNLLWFKNYSVHHWFSVDKNNIYFSDREFIDYMDLKIQYTKNKANYFDCKDDTINNEPVRLENIVIADNNGKIIKKINLFEKIIEHPELNDLVIDCIDPLHINDVRVINKPIHLDNYIFNQGDILVSLRNINTVLIYDTIKDKIKWFTCCKFFMQHSPRITPNDSFLVFDNLGGNYYSRILEIDFNTSKINGAFFGKINNFGSMEFFYTDSRGHLDVFENNILVSSTNQNIVFNLTCSELNLSLNCSINELISTSSPVTSAKFFNKNNLNFLN